MLTDDQILESWNKIHSQLGYPLIVKILPSKKKDAISEEDAAAIGTSTFTTEGRLTNITEKLI